MGTHEAGTQAIEAAELTQEAVAQAAEVEVASPSLTIAAEPEMLVSTHAMTALDEEYSNEGTFVEWSYHGAIGTWRPSRIRHRRLPLKVGEAVTRWLPETQSLFRHTGSTGPNCEHGEVTEVTARNE